MTKEVDIKEVKITEAKDSGWRVKAYPRRITLCCESDVTFEAYCSSWTQVSKTLKMLNEQGLI